MTTVQPPIHRRWLPWLAAGVTLLSPSAGLLLAGIRVRSAALPLLLLVFAAGLFWFGPSLPLVAAYGALLLLVVGLPTYVALVVLAFWIARSAPRRTPRERLRWLVLAGAFFVVWWLGSEWLRTLRATRLEPFSMSSGSMAPTLLVGDNLFLDKRPGWTPRPGEVVVFRRPGPGDLPYVKRVIGLPGDVIEVRGHELLLNGVAVLHTPCVTAPAGVPASERCAEESLPGSSPFPVLWRETPEDGQPPFQLGPSEYFMLGDERDNSMDSRQWGPVRRDQLLGHATVIWLSWDRGLRLSRIGRRL